MTFQDAIKTELLGLATLGVCSKKKALRACEIVDENEDGCFDEYNGMSVSEAASLALEVC